MDIRGLSAASLSVFLIAAASVHAQDSKQDYAGSAVCGKCHPAEYKLQSTTGHAGSLARASEHRLAREFLPFTKGWKPAPEWAFGGGIQAVTFVSRIPASAGEPSSYLEHRLSYYRSTNKLGITPGHDDAAAPGVRYPLFGASGAILRCFLCHTTGIPAVVDGEIVPAEPGVRCETCHGPGAAHAKAPGLSNIVRPGQYSPIEMNQACGSCHRKPAAKGDDTDFRNSWNARHQPIYLAQSKCFLKSEGKLSCITCHGPHGGPARAACETCHEQTKHRAALRVAGRKCEGCHMPMVRPKAELGFSNHWIGVYKPGESLVPQIRP